MKLAVISDVVNPGSVGPQVPYDWEPQARLAAGRGRADWSYALAAGRMPPAPPTIPA
jgi:hypothetical protein